MDVLPTVKQAFTMMKFAICILFQVFFSEWFNVVDFGVVLITLITSVVVVAATTGVHWAKTLGVFVFLRYKIINFGQVFMFT